MSSTGIFKRTWAQVANSRPSGTNSPFLGSYDEMPSLQAAKNMKYDPSLTTPTMRVTIEELDPRNTRLFLKLSQNEGATFLDVFSLFRSFGPIRSICFNTKRGNGVVDFVQKKSAILAKNTVQSIKLKHGTTNVKLFWGKRIDRAMPLRFVLPSLAEKVARAYSVHYQSKMLQSSKVSRGWLEESLGIEGGNGHFSENGALTARNCNNGLEEEVMGRYPLRSRDWWFIDSSQHMWKTEKSLGDLLEASYRRTSMTITLYAQHCVNFDEELPTPPKSPSSPQSEETSEDSFSNASSSPLSSSSSGYSTCICSPGSFSSGSRTEGSLPSFDDI